MIRLLLILSLSCAPLCAIATAGDTKLALQSLKLKVELKPDAETVRANITCTASLHNPGESADIELRMPIELIREADRDAFELVLDGAATKPSSRDDEYFSWQVHLDADQTVAVSWSASLGTTSLPQAHPLGQRRLVVPLKHMQGFAALPAALDIQISHKGLPAELFGHTEGTGFKLTEPVGKRMQDFHFKWIASTLADRQAALVTLRDSLSDGQRNFENRSYTDTLVSLSEIYQLADDNQAVADTCATLAALETAAGHAITGCGPWAAWRKYVPWQLRRLRALQALDQGTKASAKECMTTIEPVWKAYEQAKTNARPFDHFDAKKFGNFWDYDWVATRDLFAVSLELAGDKARADEVRKDTPPD